MLAQIPKLLSGFHLKSGDGCVEERDRGQHDKNILDGPRDAHHHRRRVADQEQHRQLHTCTYIQHIKRSVLVKKITTNHAEKALTLRENASSPLASRIDPNRYVNTVSYGKWSSSNDTNLWIENKQHAIWNDR